MILDALLTLLVAFALIFGGGLLIALAAVLWRLGADAREDERNRRERERWP